MLARGLRPCLRFEARDVREAAIFVAILLSDYMNSAPMRELRRHFTRARLQAAFRVIKNVKILGADAVESISI